MVIEILLYDLKKKIKKKSSHLRLWQTTINSIHSMDIFSAEAILFGQDLLISQNDVINILGAQIFYITALQLCMMDMSPPVFVFPLKFLFVGIKIL